MSLSKIKVLLLAFVAIVFVSLASCTSNQPISATSNPLGSKVGISSGYMLFFLPNFGEATIYNAAKNGGITKISTVDFRVTNYVVIPFAQVECIVTGE